MWLSLLSLKIVQLLYSLIVILVEVLSQTLQKLSLLLFIVGRVYIPINEFLASAVNLLLYYMNRNGISFLLVVLRYRKVYASEVDSGAGVFDDFEGVTFFLIEYFSFK